jgi:FlaA1/EpsC-like NDP-sugar epimerase
MKVGGFFFTKTSQVLIDLIIFILSYFSAFFIRFEGLPDPAHLKQMAILFPYLALARALLFFLFSIYAIAWRYISIPDVLTVVKASLPVSAALFIARLWLPEKLSVLRVPLSVIALEFMLVILGTLSARMARRLLFESSERRKYGVGSESLRRRSTLLIGAGNAGNIAIKELKQRIDLGIDVVGFIDDDPQKSNSQIQGIKVIGTTAQIPEIVQKLDIDEAIITIANASSQDIKRIVNICQAAKLKARIIPGLFEMFDDHIKITKIRDINIDDLLGRSLVRFENYRSEIVSHYRDKTILVTGAGGSIGSELCRQLTASNPRELVLLDKDENSVFEIDSELRKQTGGNTNFCPIVLDIRNSGRLQRAFEKHHPDVVFHAAAHKHVPLMEANIAEAILNNVQGTQNVAQLSGRFGVAKFIFISTDKAVNPRSIMGATKKLGEMIVQEMASLSQTNFACVRFGNVLGSRGSVVPLFQKQISDGGPLTITHPEMTRYFMSIFEAVQLIIQAGTIGNRGEIFVLDMGRPISILNLARELISLSGHREEDIEIRYTGLRPGEKLHEELLIDEERAKATQFEKIYIAPPLEVHPDHLHKQLLELYRAAEENDELTIIEHLKDIGIGFHP